jgi:hypothetical protein
MKGMSTVQGKKADPKHQGAEGGTSRELQPRGCRKVK